MIGAIASHYVAGGGASAYAAAVLADSPLAYWRLGEAAGATVMVDSSGNGRDGSYGSGTASPVLGVPGLLGGDTDTCADFDGSNDYATVVEAAWMHVGTVTLEAVVNLDTNSGDRSVIDRDSSAMRSFQFRLSGGKIQFLWWLTTGGPYFCTGATTLPTATNLHLAATYDGSTARVYVNGVADGSSPGIVGTLQTGSGAALAVGAGRGGGTTGAPAYQFLDGRIDEVAFYGAALSDTRIAAHAAAR